MKPFQVKSLSSLLFATLVLTLMLAGSNPALGSNCALNIPLNDNAAKVVISAPWWINWPDTSAAHNPSYLSNYVAVGNGTISPGGYKSWCVDLPDDINPLVTTYDALMFSSCDPSLNTYLQALGVGFSSSVYVSPATWNKVNYLLNHKNGAYFYDVQVAIWNFVGGPPTDPALFHGPTSGYPPVNTNAVNQLVAAANANAANWEPQCGDVMAVVVAIPKWPSIVQLTIIEVPVPCIPCIGVSKTIACLQPTNTLADFGKLAAGFKGSDLPQFAYGITVTNCGTVTLTNLVVLDDMFGDITTNLFAPGTTLAPGASASYYYTAALAQDTTNTVTVAGNSAASGATVQATDQAVATVETAGINCSLTIVSPCDQDGQSADNHVLFPPCSKACALTFTLKIQNSGQSDLNGVTLTSPALTALGISMPAPFDLAVGAVTNIEWTVTTDCVDILAYIGVKASIAADLTHCATYNADREIITVSCSSAGTVECKQDKENPKFIKCPNSMQLDCNPTVIPGCDLSQVEATDDNGTPTITCASVDVTNGCTVVRTITYTATDACGNTATCQQIITWTADKIAPVFTSLPAGGELDCNPTNLPTDETVKNAVTATDACTTPSVVVTHLDSGTECAMSRQFIIVATDGCGNSATNTSVVYTWSADVTPPVVTCPPDVTVSNNIVVGCSFTQGGWGSKPSGGNPGARLAAGFATVYPLGYVEVGIPGSGYSMKFTSPAAIEAYLPAGGTPKALTGDLTNPLKSPAGVFGGQVLALQLNVDFGKAGIINPIGNLVLNDPTSPLNGKTVSQILALANYALGGGSLSYFGISISDLNCVVDNLNNAFDNCDSSSWADSKLVSSTSTGTIDTTPTKTGTATATDNCDPHPVITYKDATTNSQCAAGSVIFRTWIAVDACGNTNTCTQTITIGCPPTLPPPPQPPPCSTNYVRCGDTATIGFWQNNNGKALINCLNGGANATALGNWLASNFPYLYGSYSSYNLAGKPNKDVSNYFVALFNGSSPKTEAQMLAVAFACYVTDSDLAGTVASKYGFTVSSSGTAAKYYNVKSNGAAIGLSDNTYYTVLKLLQQANLDKKNGGFNSGAFNSIFDGINSTGDIK